MDDWRMEEVTTEVRSRVLNELIEVNGSKVAALHSLEDYGCECSFPGCTSVLALTHDEYEEVRAEATHFLIALNHENPEIDRVVSENARYSVVAKFLEMPRRLARESDPRR